MSDIPRKMAILPLPVVLPKPDDGCGETPEEADHHADDRRALTPEAEARVVLADIRALLIGEAERSVGEWRLARRRREKSRITLEAALDAASAGIANQATFYFWNPSMTGNGYLSTNLLLAYAAYFVGTASPGPSNLAIMSIAASHGRKAALMFALGVVSGSMFWATVAMLGVSAALIAYSQFIIAVKIFGGLYLLWLAFKSGRNALATAAASVLNVEQAPTLTSVYSRGVMLHLTNPKAILVWVSIVALSSNSTGSARGAVVAGCAAIGCLVFGGYAVLFSTDSARRMYVRTRRALEGCLAVVFGIAGIRLLASRV